MKVHVLREMMKTKGLIMNHQDFGRMDLTLFSDLVCSTLCEIFLEDEGEEHRSRISPPQNTTTVQCAGSQVTVAKCECG